MPLENTSKYAHIKTNLCVTPWLISERCSKKCKFCYSNLMERKRKKWKE